MKAVEGRGVEVYVDGGVRQGTDVLKALALGARAVFIGRPVLWGLAYNGQEGVEKVLQILRDELKTAMMLSGTVSLCVNYSSQCCAVLQVVGIWQKYSQVLWFMNQRYTEQWIEDTAFTS